MNIGVEGVVLGLCRLQQTAGTPETNVTLAINVAKADGWASVGVPANPGQMLGANAVLFKTCPACPSGETCFGFFPAY